MERNVLVRLEYQASSGSFHSNDWQANDRNTNGYQTVSPVLNVNIATQFIEWVEDAYPEDYCLIENFQYPSFDDIFHLFQDFRKKNGL